MRVPVWSTCASAKWYSWIIFQLPHVSLFVCDYGPIRASDKIVNIDKFFCHYQHFNRCEWFVLTRQFFEADKFSNASPTKFVPVRSTCASAEWYRRVSMNHLSVASRFPFCMWQKKRSKARCLHNGFTIWGVINPAVNETLLTYPSSRP